jgi:hypothetical protein
MISDGQGFCEFRAEMRLVELDDGVFEIETLIATSKPDQTDLGNQPLRVCFLSVQMPPVSLPKPGVYRVYLICEGREIGVETIHAR